MRRLLCALLALMVALPAVPASAADTANPFTDVSEDAPYYSAVLWAAENHITLGATPTTFSPDAACTRGQVMTFLWRTMGLPRPALLWNPFTDVDESSPYYSAILWAVELGITSGVTPTTFRPNESCTKGQVVTFLWRTMNKPYVSVTGTLAAGYPAGAYYTGAVAWADSMGLLAGTDFDVSDGATRSDVVLYLHRYIAKR